ncbi:SusD/RagB family nutrient-binding outer membrane lipoprotein [Fulvivirga ligni]|uniref:SusD/RagB family nutrient-binding outer membrane lipoprotein n=1 Tax=Fulvivirga ligni TaxID=2904246 RepID=UPI001F2B4D4A|nr:SusD/RagB family nutrient-binding outer membrane lipoprotein [Fulvivirga ligni]UII22848.1 SusD/RagB family nutrient-binding outer membrane lipoprotein [Fulvivirga ligni]
MKKIIIAAVIACAAFSCTNDFEEINTNNNEPIEATPDYLLPTVIFNLADFSVNNSYGFGDIISQYAANYEYNDLDIYRWNSNGSFWGIYDYLQDLKEIEDYAIENDMPNYQAAALILEAYSFSLITDAYGDVPYTEANMAETGNITPKYDTQKTIYNGILDKLEKANALIVTGESINGDILYGGNMNKWKKLANSLRLRLLLRLSNVQDVSSEMNEIVTNAATYPVFESTGDDAIYSYSGSMPDLSPYSIGRSRPYGYFIAMPTSHLVDALKENNDPRLVEWVDLKMNDNGSFEYKGVDPGQTLGDIGRPADFSSRDSSYLNNPAKIKAIFLTYSEVNFILAEAAEKNLISGSAEDYYNKAVEASFTQWGLAMPADFLTNTVSYDANDQEQFYTQKWLALYHTLGEAWSDWRRTGMPSFIQAGSGNINNDKVPVRIMYPSLEQSVNGSNYTEASQRMGGDNINSPVWWDK